MQTCPYEISRHAASRWMQRTGLRDAVKARKAWENAWKTVVEVRLKPAHRLKTLLGHGLRDARYFKSSEGWVFVVVDNATVATVHSNTADKYEAMPGGAA